MKNLTHHFRRMPLFTKGHRLLQIRSMSPERAKTLVIYLKAFSVGVACAVILLFPLLYYSFHKPLLTAASPVPASANWTHIMATYKQVISLPDGSKITLLKGSRLSFPSDFNAQERKVFSSGEAYFEIKHDSTKPFEIITPTSIIQDLGTAFLL